MNRGIPNLAAQAVRACQDIIGPRSSLGPSFEEDFVIVRSVLRKVERAQHFLLPEGGRIMQDKLRGLRNSEIHLPFKSITVEYLAPVREKEKWDYTKHIPAEKRVVYAEETDFYSAMRIINMEHIARENPPATVRDCGPEGIMLFAMFYSIGSWSPHPMAVWIPRQRWDSDADNLPPEDLTFTPYGISPDEITPDSPFIQMTPITLMPNLMNSMLIEYEKKHPGIGNKYDRWQEVLGPLVQDMADEVGAVMELLEALSCSNVSQEIIPDKRYAKNAKRTRSGKLPVWETRQLVVDTQHGRAGRSGGTGEQGDRASPRQHLRRGHIRRLPTKNIWIQPTVVGKASDGWVEKDYVIK